MLTNKLTGAGAADKTYIEDVFSTHLYMGNDSSQTVTNGIDLAGKGGLVWLKGRNGSNPSYTDHALSDTTMTKTAQGAYPYLTTSSTVALSSGPGDITSFNSNGFSLGWYGSNSNTSSTYNAGGGNYASWTFRKAPKFFDVVTYTGNGTTKQIAHSLGSTPGMVIIKRTDNANNWFVWHRSLTAYNYSLFLELTNAQSNAFQALTQDPSSTTIFLADSSLVNASGGTYVAYLFAHDTTTDGLIQCGSYTGNGSATGPTITLGWEPQWLMIKNATGTGNWQIIDNMRGMPVGSADATLQANLSNAESSVDYVSPTAIGFQVTSTSTEVNTSGSTYIYMAIRRGPMRTPTNGATVFEPNVEGIGSTYTYPIQWKYPFDMMLYQHLINGDNRVISRLQGDKKRLATNSTAAEVSALNYPAWADIDWTPGGYPGIVTVDGDGTGGSYNYATYKFRRAPGFFDVVCYTGTGAARTVNHNLGVAPELVFIKQRNSAGKWNAATKFYSSYYREGEFNSTLEFGFPGYTSTGVHSGIPTASSIALGTNSTANQSTGTYVAFLFATLPGVSKIGNYSGDGNINQTINCGFTSGARFVMIKRTDYTGDWYVWDTARGIVAATDPHLSLNTTAAEVTTDDSVDPISSGFVVNQVAATNLNELYATYIYLAIA